jgi:beta-galactosidase
VATTDLDDTYTNARLDLSVDVKNYSDKPEDDYSLRAVLYNPVRSIVKSLTSGKFTIQPGAGHTVKLSDIIKNPAKWSAEYPNLYYLTFELINSSGQTRRFFQARSFRRLKLGVRCFILTVFL